MSYRALKKLIGETSLERKCRFLFGAALGLLVTASLWWHASRTRDLVDEQQVNAARRLVPQILRLHHYQKLLPSGVPGSLDPEHAEAFLATFSGGNDPVPGDDLPIWQLISTTAEVSSAGAADAWQQFVDRNLLTAQARPLGFDPPGTILW
ncbi:MAG: hypothetical protein ACKPJD_32295 [Planctomycetaceae bacterium]